MWGSTGKMQKSAEPCAAQVFHSTKMWRVRRGSFHCLLWMWCGIDPRTNKSAKRTTRNAAMLSSPDNVTAGSSTDLQGNPGSFVYRLFGGGKKRPPEDVLTHQRSGGGIHKKPSTSSPSSILSALTSKGSKLFSDFTDASCEVMGVFSPPENAPSSSTEQPVGGAPLIKKVLAREITVQRVESGSRIHLKAKHITVTIEQYDAVGRRYLLRDDRGKKWYEALDGPGAAVYRLLARPYKPPPPPAERKEGAMSLRSTRQQQASSEVPLTHSRTIRTAAAAAAAAQVECGICLDVICEGEQAGTGAGGRMPCCEQPVHMECIARWRRESMAPQRINGRPSDYKLADFRRCPFCKTLSNGTLSARRYFSNLAPVH